MDEVWEMHYRVEYLDRCHIWRLYETALGVRYHRTMGQAKRLLLEVQKYRGQVIPVEGGFHTIPAKARIVKVSGMDYRGRQYRTIVEG